MLFDLTSRVYRHRETITENWLKAIAPIGLDVFTGTSDCTRFIRVVVETELVLLECLMKFFPRKERRERIKEFSIIVFPLRGAKNHRISSLNCRRGIKCNEGE